MCRSKRKEEQEKAGEALKANTHCTHALQTITALLRHSELPKIVDQHSDRDPAMNGHEVNIVSLASDLMRRFSTASYNQCTDNAVLTQYNQLVAKQCYNALWRSLSIRCLHLDLFLNFIKLSMSRLSLQ